MLRRIAVLGAAVAAVAVFALPGGAGANWGHKGEVIQENVTYTIGAVSLTGTARFQGGLGGIECQVSSSVLLEPGTTGTLKTFAPDPLSGGTPTNRCKGLGGLAFCQVHQFEPTGLAWIIHTASETTISITTGDIHLSTTGGFCPVKSIATTSATVTGTVNNAKSISSMQLSGASQAHLETSTGTLDSENVTISGTLQVSGLSSGTYEM